jgi:hypothetical protein
MQLVGWNKGGQDRDNPLHDPDAHLGTEGELRQAIADIQKLGVHMILFSKFTWADMSSDWFHSQLKDYVTRDPYGDFHTYSGYDYQTTTQLAQINTRRFAIMCPLSSTWRDMADREFRKVIGYGGDGMLYDEAAGHGGVYYCFANNHGHHIPAHVYPGALDLAKGFRSITKDRPDFLYSGEAPFGIQEQYYSLSYFRINSKHTPGVRYIDPHRALMIAVTGFDDREMINRALLYRYVISYEPYNFKGHLEDYPLTLSYGKKVDALRKRYHEYIWDGDYRDTQEAEVSVDGKAYELFSVFRHKSGKHAVIVVNDSADKPIVAEVKIDHASGRYVVATPEEPDGKESGASVTVPPRSAVVLIEK